MPAKHHIPLLFYVIGVGVITIIILAGGITLNLPADTILNSSLTIGSILVAVIGILLSLYISQRLKGTSEGQNYSRLILLMLIVAITSFGSGILALFVLAGKPSQTLLEVSLALFISSIYGTVVAISSAAGEILWY
jgi:hypothetical protein